MIWATQNKMCNCICLQEITFGMMVEIPRLTMDRCSPLLMLVLLACSPSVNRQNAIAAKPEWLGSRPSASEYYSGIGHSSKGPGINHLQAAKKSALEDLAGDIRVNLKASSTLSLMDAGKVFTEKYEQIINTTVADDLEEYEVGGTWEDATDYWIYYRLSKSRYADLKRRRLEEATALAFDFFTKARDAGNEGKIAVALGFSIQGLRALEKYLAEPVRVRLGDQEVLLNNELTGFIQSLLDRIKLNVNPESVVLNRRQAMNTTALTVLASDRNTGKPIADLSLLAGFEKGSGELVSQLKTLQNGVAPIQLKRITSAESEQSLLISVVPQGHDSASVSAISRLILSRMVIPQTRMQIKVNKPLILLSANERLFGKAASNPRITNTIRNYLTAQGFGFTSDQSVAELILEFETTTEQGSVSGSLYITYLDAVIRVRSADNRQELYTATLDRIKGYSLDYERSGQDASTKAIQLLEKEKLPALLDILLR